MAKIMEGNPYYYSPQKYKYTDVPHTNDYAYHKYQINKHGERDPIARNVTQENASSIVDALNFSTDLADSFGWYLFNKKHEYKTYAPKSTT